MKRDLTIDTLRGLVLIIMALNHFGGPIKKITYQPLGFVSAAEGFIFISGYIYGIVYGRYHQNIRVLFTKTYSRAFLIYKYHIALITFVFIAHILIKIIFIFIDNNYGPEDLIYFPIVSAIPSLFLLYQPWMLDILPLYVMFVLIGPYIIISYDQNREIFIFFISFLLWFFMQIFCINNYLNNLFGSITFIKLGYYNIIAWQIIFVTGVFIGVRKLHRKRMKYFYSIPIVIITTCTFILLFLIRHHILQFDIINLHLATGSKTFSWLRLLNFIIIAYLFSWLIKIRIIKNIPVLTYLGQHSLQVFTFHVFLLYLIIPIKSRIMALGDITAIVASILFGFSLYIPAYYHKNYNFIKLRMVRKKIC